MTPATERPPGALGWIAVVLLAAGGVALTPGLTFDYNLLKLQSPALDSVVWEHVMLDRDPRSLFCVSLCRTREELEARRKQFEQLEAVGRVESMFPAQEERKRAILTRLGDRIEPLQIPPLALPDPDRIRTALAQLARVTDDPPFRNLHKISYGVHDRIGANPTPEERDRVFTILRDTERRIRDQLAEGLDRVKRMCRPAPIDAAALPLEMRRMFVGSKSGAHALKINPAGDIWDWDSLQEFVSAARQIDPKIVGVPVQTFESSRLLLRAFLKAAWISLCAITLLIGLSFWNLKDLVTALSPLLLGLALLLGIMRLTGISFNFANFFAVPILIGTAVDHGVHLVNSARVGTPLASTRRAVTLCSLTTIIGFGMLAFSAHRGIASLGQVLAIGSACSLLVSHTVTEALIRRWRPTPDATA